MKRFLVLSFFLASLVLGFFFILHVGEKSNDNKPYPQPFDTEVKWDMEDGNKPDRKAAIENMHRAAEGTDWRKIEYQNSLTLTKEKNLLRAQSNKDPGDQETIVEDYLSGIWYERGSKNQAGSVIVTDYVVETDKIYTISAGGNLWEGNLDGSQWTPINEDLRFFDRFLFVNKLNGNYRMVAAVNGQPSYSDDMGVSWINSIDIPSTSSGWNIRHATRIKRQDGSMDIFFLMKKGYWEDVKLYKSSDHGESYTELMGFNSNDHSNFVISNPNGTEDLFLIEQISNSASKVHRYDIDSGEMNLVTSNSPISYGGNGRANLSGVSFNNGVRLFSYNNSEELYVSDDLGVTWQYLSTLPIRPWTVGLYLSPSNPDLMIIGGVNAYRSLDGGISWELINEWWEYYSNVEFKLHADMMYFNEFEDQQGNPFMLISNHGGMNVSYNNTITNRNISLSGLNVSQYYSVRTSSASPYYFFAGSQDQGFQRGQITTPLEAADLEQAISGDYGHIIFTDNDSKLFTVYPGGWVTYYADPFNLGLTSTYDIVSPDESVWIPPLMPHPNENVNIAYVAGGNVDTLPGRHIIELEPQGSGPTGGTINARALPFDFSVSDGNISAMETNHFDHDYWYVATDNGKFYRSDDGGNSFTEKAFNLPGGHYLYGSDIMSSEIDQDVIYMSGSGYSNAPVIKSEDNGETWSSMSSGLPNTMAFGLATNPDESLIFAATEAGPFVYIADLETWHPLAATTAPLTTYWSVEFVDQINMARFGTYGRGTWDFEVVGTVSTEEPQKDIVFKIYPNPVIDEINLSLSLSANYKISVNNMEGKTILTDKFNSNVHSLNVSQLSSGTYVLTIHSNNQKITSKVFIKAE